MPVPMEDEEEGSSSSATAPDCARGTSGEDSYENSVALVDERVRGEVERVRIRGGSKVLEVEAGLG